MPIIQFPIPVWRTKKLLFNTKTFPTLPSLICQSNYSPTLTKSLYASSEDLLLSSWSYIHYLSHTASSGTANSLSFHPFKYTIHDSALKLSLKTQHTIVLQIFMKLPKISKLLFRSIFCYSLIYSSM